MEGLMLVLLFVGATVAAIALAMASGDRYSQRDAEAHAADYAGVIREAHGPLTAFLWASYAVIGVWTVAYLVMHWSEFAGWF